MPPFEPTASSVARSPIAIPPSESGVPAVLAVDDSLANLELLQQLLIREGYAVIQAPDGEEAFDIVKTASPDPVIALQGEPARDAK